MARSATRCATRASAGVSAGTGFAPTRACAVRHSPAIQTLVYLTHDPGTARPGQSERNPHPRTQTMDRTLQNKARHEELPIADLDAIVGGAPTTTATQQAGGGKGPNHFVVIAIIAILIG